MEKHSADLRSVKAKLRRAKEHCGTLKSEFRIWGEQQSDPGRYYIRRDGAWYVLIGSPLPLIPDTRLAAIAGDIFHNLRSALDHMVWQLVLRDGHEPSRENQFPIYESKDSFLNEVKFRKKNPQLSVLYGIVVDGDAWTIIERAQPYNGNILLTVVKRFSNMDKHKTLCTQLSFPHPDDIAKVVGWNPDAVLLEQRFSWQPLSCEKTTELARYRFSDQPNPNMYVKAGLPAEPTFGEGPIKSGYQISIGGINTIIDTVKTLVNQISKLPRVIDSE